MQLIILICVIMFVGQTIVIKLFNEKYMKNMACFFYYYLLSCVGTVAMLLATKSGATEAIDPKTLLLGVIFGVIFIFTILIYGLAMKSGPLSYTSLLFSAGMLIVVLSGVTVFHEKMSVTQVIGLILVLVTFYLASVQNEDNPSGKVNLRWILLVFATFLLNGTLGVISKTHQYFLPGRQVEMYLAVGFATGAVLSALGLAYYIFVKKQTVVTIAKPGFYGTIFGISFTNYLGNMLITRIMSKVPAGVLFPIINGSVMLLVIIASRLIFGEKISARKLIGIAIGGTAIIMLSMG